MANRDRDSRQSQHTCTHPKTKRRRERAIERAAARALLSAEERDQHDIEAKAAYDYTHGGAGTIPPFQYVNDLLSS